METIQAPFEIDRRGLSDQIYQALKREILSGRLAPGQRLSLDEFAARFGVSVTPIRDALRLLAADGLVELLSRRGTFVTWPSRQTVQEVFQIREFLECAAVDYVIARGSPALEKLEGLVAEIEANIAGESHTDYLAYIQRDQCIHQLLIDCVGNQKLSETYAGLGVFSIIAHLLYSAGNQRASATLAEHRAILAALRRGDAEAARAAIRTHLRNARDEALRRVEKAPPGKSAVDC
mgnify:FL=1